MVGPGNLAAVMRALREDPAFRFELHRELAGKLRAIAAWPRTAPVRLNPHAAGRRAVVASGGAAAHAGEVLLENGLWDSMPAYKVIQPYPLHSGFIAHIIESYEEILVLEETAAVVEMQILDRQRVRGRMTGAVPEAGELLPEIVERLIAEFAGLPAAAEGAAAAVSSTISDKVFQAPHSAHCPCHLLCSAPHSLQT